MEETDKAIAEGNGPSVHDFEQRVKSIIPEHAHYYRVAEAMVRNFNENDQFRNVYEHFKKLDMQNLKRT